MIGLEVDGDNVRMYDLNNKSAKYIVDVIYKRQSNYAQFENLISNIDNKDLIDEYVCMLERMKLRIIGRRDNL